MKSLLIIASFVALAVASPTHRGIEAGPAMIDFEPNGDGPTIFHVDPISIGRAIVRRDPITVSVVQNAEDVRSATSLIQIIVNMDGDTSIVNAPINVIPAASAIVAEPEHIVEDIPEAVQVVEADPEPVQIIEVAPEPVQVVEVAPAPIGTPDLPTPVVVLPELN